MKKQFKLIKQYPDSGVELGEVLTFSDGITEIQKLADDGDYWVYRLSYMEDYPEFWEKIEETEKLCVPVGTKFTAGTTTIYSIEVCPYLGKYRITYPTGYMDMKISEINNSLAKGFWKIYVEKPVLFVTEDGKEIREGDFFYPVDLVITNLSKVYTYAIADKACNKDRARANGYIWFSTEQAAQEYIDMNEPIYSKKQAIAMLGALDWYITGTQEDLIGQYNDFLL